MRYKNLALTISMALGLLITSCITSIDESLPYAELPQITVGTAFSLVASPSHPTSAIAEEKVPTGAKVNLLGKDQDGAWLLVEHDNTLGWMPAFYAKTNVSALESAILFDPIDPECNTFQGTLFTPDDAWTSTASGNAIAIGSVYLPKATDAIEDASLELGIDGNGAIVDADYVHTSLTESVALILFAFDVNGLSRGSQLSFETDVFSDVEFFFQAAFFSNDCSLTPNRLPIGMLKSISVDAEIASDSDNSPTSSLTADEDDETAQSETTSDDSVILQHRYINQWASSVIGFSNQYDSGQWSAKQVIGEPNVTVCDDVEGAWTTSNDGNVHYVEVGFEEPVLPEKLLVRQNYAVGSVVKLEFLDPESRYLSIPVTDTLTACPGTSEFIVKDTVDFETSQVRVFIDTGTSSAYEEIDAIAIEGLAKVREEEKPDSIEIANPTELLLGHFKKNGYQYAWIADGAEKSVAILDLVIDGSRVEMNYDLEDGVMEGELTDNVYKGHWTQSEHKGDFEFVFTSDFSSAIGWFTGSSQIKGLQFLR